MDENDPVEETGIAAWAPARERVYRHVLDGILRGRLAAGTFLEEESVSAAVGVSRTPVREAFHRLHAERLIELMPRRGALVRPVTLRELLEINESRLMIETHVARALCRARRPVPPEMAGLLDEMRQARPDDLFGHVRLNAAFHRALVGASGNEVMAGLYDSLSVRQQRVAMTAVCSAPGRLRVIQEEHAALLAALDAGDADTAAAILARHLRPVPEIVSRLPDGEDTRSGTEPWCPASG